jgi:hypothetical protein
MKKPEATIQSRAVWAESLFISNCAAGRRTEAWRAVPKVIIAGLRHHIDILVNREPH